MQIIEPVVETSEGIRVQCQMWLDIQGMLRIKVPGFGSYTIKPKSAREFCTQALELLDRRQ